MRRAARVDIAQAPIVEGLRMHGIFALPMPIPGDLLTFRPQTNTWIPMEVKTMRHTSHTFKNGTPKKIHVLTESQKKRASQGCAVPIVMNLTEALALHGIQLENK